MKVTIINVPEDKNVEGENGCSPPLGCVGVASAAQETGACAYFVDGQHHTTLEDSLARVPEGTDIAGISFNRISIPNVRPLIKELLQRDVKRIVAGGQAVIPVSELFVRDFSDPRIMACYGDGEPTIQGLVRQRSLGEIPNLVYFDGGQAKRTPVELIDYRRMNLECEVEGFDWKDYFAYSQRFLGDKRASAYFTDGCPRRIIDDEGCSFCARRRTGAVRSVAPEQAYSHLKFLKGLGAHHVSINDDTFFGSPGFLQELAKQFERQGPLELSLHVYGGVSELNRQRLDLAKAIGVSSILVGIESGSETVRRLNGKPISDELIWKTGQLCKERGISYDAALIIGLIGETRETARATVELARRLSEERISSNVYASLFMPYPGSSAYNTIQAKLAADPALRRRFGDQFSRWDYDWSVQSDAQLEINTRITRAQACGFLDEIRIINEANGVRPIIADYSRRK